MLPNSCCHLVSITCLTLTPSLLEACKAAQHLLFAKLRPTAVGWPLICLHVCSCASAWGMLDTCSTDIPRWQFVVNAIHMQYSAQKPHLSSAVCSAWQASLSSSLRCRALAISWQALLRCSCQDIAKALQEGCSKVADQPEPSR